MPSVFILAASPLIRAQDLVELPTLGQVELKDATVATCSGRLTAEDVQRSAFDVAITTGPQGHHTVNLLGIISKTLVPGGKLVVKEVGLQETSSLQKNLLLSGYTAIQVLPNEGGCFSAAKPLWETGSKAAISLKPPSSKTWTLPADEEDELIDEDDLLTEEDLRRPVPSAAENGDDCEVGAGKKACANCTCGRAEGKEHKLTKEMIENPTSGCGSCSMGDAFRCAGCPYRGLPAFEMGKKIELPADFLLSDLE